MNTVAPLPMPTNVSAPAVTRRMPKRSISAAANGAVSPNSTRFTPTAADSTHRGHPYSASIGTISTPGAARNPAAPTSATNATAATSQAGCNRRPVGGAGALAARDGVAVVSVTRRA
jgi:hypothetical protein